MLDEYVRQFPKGKGVSLGEVSTPLRTDRTLYIHDVKGRVIHSTASIDVKDEEILIAKLRHFTRGGSKVSLVQELDSNSTMISTNDAYITDVETALNSEIT
jgi:hypothetical protein